MSIFFEALWTVTLDLAPWLLLGAGVAGLLHVLLPVGFVHRNLRGRGGVLKAVLLGVPLPLCSCGVIPAGLGLKRDGASDGASVGFLISTPQTGVDSVLVSASFLGWPFALFKVASAFALGLLGGLITDRVSNHEPPPPVAAGTTPRPSWRDGVAHTVDIIRTIWLWLVFGVVVSAAITAFVPEGAFASLAEGGTALAMLAVLVISLPLYVCATASVPIAAALVAGGFPPGAALVFLMAGPATNLATVGAVSRAFGGRVLAVYLGTIIVGSVSLGWAFDFVLVGKMGMHAAHHEHGNGIVGIAAAVVLLSMFAAFAIEDLRRRFRRVSVEATTVHVAGMTCNGCARKVERGLAELEGVTAAVVDLDGARVEITGSVDMRTALARIRELGFVPSVPGMISVSVQGLTCDGCVRKLEGKLRGEAGVDDVWVDREEGSATVRGDINEHRVQALVREAGFVPVQS